MFNHPDSSAGEDDKSFLAWARTTTSSFARLCLGTVARAQPPGEGVSLIYRLRRWPTLPADSRTAEILRTLSVMSQRPVNRNWILMSTALKPAQVDRLLQFLIDQGVVDVIDSAGFAATAD
jgi:hypothetical protein